MFGDIELTVESIKNAATYQDLDEKVDSQYIVIM